MSPQGSKFESVVLSFEFEQLMKNIDNKKLEIIIAVSLCVFKIFIIIVIGLLNLFAPVLLCYYLLLKYNYLGYSLQKQLLHLQ